MMQIKTAVAQSNKILGFSLIALSLVTPASLQGADASGWRKIELGGETKCADGSPFSIFLNQGTSGRLVIDFMGGGACWDSQTCRPGAINYTNAVPDVIGQWIPESWGIYDRSRADNPFRNDTHVLIPYCTGDVHWGSADQIYTDDDGSPYTVHHRGGVNAKAALDEVFSTEASTAKEVVVTGCSAGAYASIWWTPYIRLLSPGSRMIQFSDSGAGVLTPEFRNSGMVNWQIEKSAPAWIPGLDPNETDLYHVSLDSMYTAISKAHPDIRLSQYNSLNDVLQRWFYQLMGGNIYGWSDVMQESVTTAAVRAPNFHYFVAPWDAHCILPYDSFYERTSDAPHGIPFHDWITNLLGTSVPVNEPCDGCQIDRP